MSDKKEGQQGLNIELSEEVAEGTYSNLAIIVKYMILADIIKNIACVPAEKVI